MAECLCLTFLKSILPLTNRHGFLIDLRKVLEHLMENNYNWPSVYMILGRARRCQLTSSIMVKWNWVKQYPEVKKPMFAISVILFPVQLQMCLLLLPFCWRGSKTRCIILLFTINHSHIHPFNVCSSHKAAVSLVHSIFRWHVTHCSANWHGTSILYLVCFSGNNWWIFPRSNELSWVQLAI